MNYRDNFKGQVDIFRYTVSHQLKDTIRRDECDTSVSIKTAQSHALMKLDVINLNTTVLFRGISILYEKLVINAEFALRHP